MTARPLRLAVTGLAPPEQVWARYADPDLWPTWSEQVRRVDVTVPLAAGRAGTVHGPPGVRAEFEITSWRAPTAWSWRVVPVLAGRRLPAVDLDHTVEAAAAGGSRAGLVLRGPSLLVAGYAPAAWWALRRLVRP